MRAPTIEWLRWAGRSTANLLFPPRCAFCFRDMEDVGDVLLCAACRASLVDEESVPCPRCAAPLPDLIQQATDCPHCRTEKFAFSRVVALGAYQDTLQEAVLRMKRPTAEPLAMAVARLLVARLKAGDMPPPDAAAPVPMHWMRRAVRGTNCADLLAETMARQLGVPSLPDLLTVARWRPRQHLLTPAQRRLNMRQAFRVSRCYDVNGARVLLVDDALTTGATAHAAALALKRAGIREVTVAVVARGIGV